VQAAALTNVLNVEFAARVSSNHGSGAERSVRSARP